MLRFVAAEKSKKIVKDSLFRKAINRASPKPRRRVRYRSMWLLKKINLYCEPHASEHWIGFWLLFHANCLYGSRTRWLLSKVRRTYQRRSANINYYNHKIWTSGKNVAVGLAPSPLVRVSAEFVRDVNWQKSFNVPNYWCSCKSNDVSQSPSRPESEISLWTSLAVAARATKKSRKHSTQALGWRILRHFLLCLGWDSTEAYIFILKIPLRHALGRRKWLHERC